MLPNLQKSQKAPKVLCFGEALIDRLGSPGIDPFRDRDAKDCLGGAPANVACALAKLGAEVAFLGNLGDDKIGNRFKKLMLERGIDISCLNIDSQLPSRVVMVRRDLYGERSFDGFAGNEGSGFADEYISLNLIRKHWSFISGEADWLVVGTIPLAANQSSESLWWCIKQASLHDIQIAIDINWRPVFWNSQAKSNESPSDAQRELIKPLLEMASLIKLSKEEAIWFFNTNDPYRISISLPKRPDIVVTDGSNPILWSLKGFNGQTNPVTSISVIDTTGAGDAFTAGLIFKLIQQRFRANSDLVELNKIVLFAASCGAIVCTAPGAIESQPNYYQVEEFLADNGG